MIALSSSGVLVAISAPSRANVSTTLGSLSAASTAALIFSIIPRGVPLGAAIGYKVRFNDQVGTDTLVKLMTDGILLAETQRERNLGQYDTLIIDEAQTMGFPQLELLRQLINVETNESKLLQVVLFAQEELRNTLTSSAGARVRVKAKPTRKRAAATSG